MHHFIRVFCLLTVIMSLSFGLAFAEDTKVHDKKVGPYLVVEGNVTHISARMLVVEGRQYPISKFARVFETSEKGPEMSVQAMAQVGKIEKARLYILNGRVEKIIVIVQLF